MHQQKFHILQSSDRGFTLIELLIVIFVIAALAGIAVFAFATFTKRAYNIIAQHDLKNFIQAEKSYYKAKSLYLGASGDFIEDTLADPFDQAGFTFDPSSGVRMAIVAGDGTVPKSFLKVEASHRNGDVIYTYDFANGKISIRIKE